MKKILFIYEKSCRECAKRFYGKLVRKIIEKGIIFPIFFEDREEPPIETDYHVIFTNKLPRKICDYNLIIVYGTYTYLIQMREKLHKNSINNIKHGNKKTRILFVQTNKT